MNGSVEVARRALREADNLARRAELTDAETITAWAQVAQAAALTALAVEVGRMLDRRDGPPPPPPVPVQWCGRCDRGWVTNDEGVSRCPDCVGPVQTEANWSRSWDEAEANWSRSWDEGVTR